jgi:hypothetical protein
MIKVYWILSKIPSICDGKVGGTYPVQSPFSCNPTNNVHKKNLKKFTNVLSTLLYLHIEFQD